MGNSTYVEIDYFQNRKMGYNACGDVFLSRRDKDANRTTMVLSDGLGSGVKANVLATLTASMAMNFTNAHEKIGKVAETILNTLPICSVRKISYSTFTIVDVEYDGCTRIMEFDNPRSLLLRDGKIFDPGWETMELKGKNLGRTLHYCHFQAKKEDRIISWSDGVIQSGIGTSENPFGWGRQNAVDFTLNAVLKNRLISARDLSRKLVDKSELNDYHEPQDDTTCSVIYFREPRKLLLLSGPPFDEKKDTTMAMAVRHFKGKKIVSGGTTAAIVSRELGVDIEVGMRSTDPEVPPISYMEGMDLVTEGILTIGKVVRFLENSPTLETRGDGPAEMIISHLRESDIIHILAGTRVNNAHQDPNLPVELEIRRNIMKKLKRLLEEKFMKEVNLQFI